MRVYTSKLTPDSIVTYLFHDVWMRLFCLAWHVRTVRWSAVISVHNALNTVCASGVLTCSARVCSVWEIDRVLLRISIWSSCHGAGFYVANRAVTPLLLLRRRLRVFSAFCCEYSPHAHRHSTACVHVAYTRTKTAKMKILLQYAITNHMSKLAHLYHPIIWYKCKSLPNLWYCII